jgi:hypothetical protein
MKITRRRISKLRKTYGPRASRVRLRLTDKRLRALERERIHSGKTFESVWRKYRKERLDESARNQAKRYGITKAEAAEFRRRSIKEHVPFKFFVIKEEKPKEKPSEEFYLPMDTDSLYSKIRTLQGFEKSGEQIGPEFVLTIDFGAFHYSGPPSGFPKFKEIWHIGDELYSRNSPWWGHNRIVQTWEVDFKSFRAVIATDGSTAPDEDPEKR